MTMSPFVKRMIQSRQLNFEEGRFDMMGLRGVILPCSTFTSLLEIIYREDGKEVLEILFEVGRDHGETAVEKVGRELQVEKREFLGKLLVSGNAMGVGKFELENLDMEEKEMRVVVKDSPFLEEFQASDVLKEIDVPVDHFQRGIFHEFGRELFGTEVESIERKCRFLGHDRCIIEVEAKE